MKYVNANEILPKELLSTVRQYYQGGYLYIPRENDRRLRRQTDYKLELENRNKHIFAKHLAGRTHAQLGKIYHLSQSSIRRIILREKVRNRIMEEIIEQMIPLWGIEKGQLRQIYSSTWEINHSYVVKIYDDIDQLKRNVKISNILSTCNIPVADIVLTKTGEEYAAHGDVYFLMSRKLQGSIVSNIKDKIMVHEMGRAIARLHEAFIQCETELEFWDNSLLEEMRGWVRETLSENGWQIIGEKEYEKTVEALEDVYDALPKQLIHRDVHFGNFLFFEGDLSGYIDFDLSQRNIRIFDICYFLTGLLVEETEDALTENEWLENVKAAIAGYESISTLLPEEKNAVPCVMECIEILCAAYFISVKDMKRADDACRVFHLIQDYVNLY